MDTFRTVIHAQSSTVWNLLLERIENPRSFDPGILEMQIVQRSPEGVVRETRTREGHMRERISAEEKEHAVHAVLLEHPTCRGTVVMRVLPTSGQNPMAPVIVETQVRLEVRDEYWGLHDPRRQISKHLQEEMDRLRQQAEEQERNS